MQTKWIFFDIGDVLFDEDAQHRYIFHSMLLALRRNGVEVTWDDYFDRLRERARVKPGTAFEDAVGDYYCRCFCVGMLKEAGQCWEMEMEDLKCYVLWRVSAREGYGIWPGRLVKERADLCADF